MPIDKVERFHCRLCDFITEDPMRIKRIKETGGKCPACGDGKPVKWKLKRKNKYG